MRPQSILLINYIFMHAQICDCDVLDLDDLFIATEIRQIINSQGFPNRIWFLAVLINQPHFGRTQAVGCKILTVHCSVFCVKNEPLVVCQLTPLLAYKIILLLLQPRPTVLYCTVPGYPVLYSTTVLQPICRPNTNGVPDGEFVQ